MLDEHVKLTPLTVAKESTHDLAARTPRTIEDIFGISNKLGAAQNATSLAEFFSP